MKIYRYEALENELREQLLNGRYRNGERLPSIRTLCADYGVSKATVLHALHRLESDQWVVAQPKSGYFVQLPTIKSPKPNKVDTPVAPAPVTVPAIFRDIMGRSAAFDILPADGFAESSQHLVLLNRLISRRLRTHPEQKANYYDEPAGKIGLREALTELYRQRLLNTTPEEICITSGCQHALFLALMATCKRGDTVAVESPAFYGVLQIMEQLELNIIEISADAEMGLDVTELAEKISRWPIKACVVSPNFGTPTGSQMPLASRQRLLQLALQHQFYVIEDDIYGDLAFGSESPAPLKALDEHQQVILCGSFSKSLSRDLRIGWIMGAALQDKLVQLKLITQLASPQAVQGGLAQFIAEGHYRRYVAQYKQRLREQRDQLLYELKQHWGDKISYSQPKGGLCLWVELPAHIDTQISYQGLLEQGVVLTPGVLFSAHGLYHNYLRISFSQPLTTRRRAALHQLFQALL
ncbi:DNA-binding transcriptional regulator, MocR family, contains an aminotransferase domain [Oceanospirillum multiglobuliferum]|uniref:HTH gntR-type domain-containing protein n=1 Tax=Oceanospirillum multiglobuliferum TaxID=64969 RepID=A0A1T4PUT6_9GAMM|nr:PLP-dependent aminotransferase family protein [Oceanospirillum multiglobuliferum]OPX55317.1 hypothetical protein BTE48_09105 [Oceanospirillum multiglobuliferum]SJZ95011.1 DNA-binding transcriptional regulator, MocR family, contains an aminotransferase domain [Oceanospirillum multiglobuliferum]